MPSPTRAQTTGPASSRPLPTVGPRRAALCAALLLAAPLDAQRVQGPAEDALVLPRGVLRASVGGLYESADERYSTAPDGAATGGRRPYGASLSRADLELALAGGGALEARLRELTGRGDLQLSFGQSVVRADANRVVIPMRMEVGLGWRLQLSAMVPYVRSRVSTDLRLNETGTTGNVGINPALLAGSGALATNTALVAALQQGAAALAAAIAACDGGTAGPVCSDIAGATAAQAAATAAATELATIYGAGDVPGAPVVPVTGSVAAGAVAQRLEAIRLQLEGYDVAGPAEGAAPVAASGPLTATQFQAVLADAGFGLQLEPLRDVSRYGIGDVEVGASFQLFDSFGGDVARATAPTGTGLRVAVGGLVRLGTGRPDGAASLLDVGTGDGQTDLELRAAADVFTGGRLWTSVTARYGIQLEDELERRVPSVEGQLFVPAANLRQVRRDLGDYMALEVAPRYAFSDFLAVGATYRYWRKEADSFALAGGDPSSAPLAVAALAFGTEAYEHRVGLGFALSTVRGFARGTVGVPIDVQYLHSRSVAGGGALTPAATRDEVTVRLYLQPFGGR